MGRDVKRDLVQPSLLDRLTDDEPRNSCEAQDKRSFSVRQLEEVILRDVSWLLNTNQLGATVDLQAYPHVAASALNYGAWPLSGQIREGMDKSALREAIIESLQRFEPRLLPDTLKVTVLDDGQGCGTFRFRIEADLWAQPLPVRMVMRTEVNSELESARVLHLGTEIS
ncbi:type VI secretion system baseplate subunit TssE [Rhizobium lentis]|uniref:Type VI secretion system protein ImpF n=1 Tax=Rhizobium lentis TaxID=1138194 RepID=A0A7W8XJ30_9HYPH|nr:type VI secretion system baseplate subunit TssE [Rhizobium lentis]MBB4577289.1 type VI secretion system protein ImpF [Rhizobium lentis]MBB5553896.1 type VI secretion system protein ImpF [Rhizobium lentis]MBB5563844.1 type VI secretion system protein ImpF [Rhizobium lentis]MBB5570888.1 type VI secretion system protein ImpF [Rhizobium lentis]